jgi:hypothetical protein
MRFIPEEVLARATVTEVGPGFFCRVRLDHGEKLGANIPKGVAREMFRVFPGGRVWVAFHAREAPEVRGFARISAEPAAAPDRGRV